MLLIVTLGPGSDHLYRRSDIEQNIPAATLVTPNGVLVLDHGDLHWYTGSVKHNVNAKLG